MRELFIYYLVSPAHATPFQAAAHAMQARLRTAHPSLQARLMLRHPLEDPGEGPGQPGLHTWMETYASPAGIDASLQADIERAAEALLPWLAGPRHTEAFVPCA